VEKETVLCNPIISINLKHLVLIITLVFFPLLKRLIESVHDLLLLSYLLNLLDNRLLLNQLLRIPFHFVLL
jgi:hypothetical protein